MINHQQFQVLECDRGVIDFDEGGVKLSRLSGKEVSSRMQAQEQSTNSSSVF